MPYYTICTMCMHIIAVRCLSTSIVYCPIAFLFFPSFTLSPSFLSSLFFPSFPSYLLPLLPFLSASLPPSLSILPLLLFLPLYSFQPLHFLLSPLPQFLPFFPFDPSFPCSPPSRPTPYFFPIFPIIKPLLFSTLHSFLSLFSILPLNSFHPTPPFLPIPASPPFLLTPSFNPIPPSHHTPLFLPIPPSLPPLLFFISLLSLSPPSLPLPRSFLFSPSSFVSFPTTPSLPTPQFFPTLYPFIPTPPFPVCLLPFVSLCYLPPLLLFLPLLTSTSHFLPTSPSFPFSPSSLTFHFLIIHFASFSPPSFALLHSFSPY